MQMMVIQYFYTKDIDDDAFQYSHIGDTDGDSSDDDGLDDDVLTKPLSRVKFKHF